MVSEKVKSELKRFLSVEQIENLSKQFGAYEKLAREVVKQFDVKGREAKARGQAKLDKFASQVKTTRTQVEKQLQSLVREERQSLNKGLNDLFTYFKTLTAASSKKSAPKKRTGSKSRKASTKKTTSKGRRS